MTVKELKEMIAEVPDDVEVFALFDGWDSRLEKVSGGRYADENEEKEMILYC